MGLVKRALAFFFVMAYLHLSFAAVYKVGDSTGWTTIGNFDYKQWSATQIFHVGDIILFEYNTQHHNVLQVTHPQYQACNSSAPLATHTTGNDSITITNRGHHYFLCGFPGHCQSGQKVDINVLRTPIAPTPSPASSPPSGNSSGAVPAPSPNNAASLNGLLSKLGLGLTIFAAFVSGLF